MATYVPVNSFFCAFYVLGNSLSFALIPLREADKDEEKREAASAAGLLPAAWLKASQVLRFFIWLFDKLKKKGSGEPVVDRVSNRNACELCLWRTE